MTINITAQHFRCGTDRLLIADDGGNAIKIDGAAATVGDPNGDDTISGTGEAIDDGRI